MSLSDQPRIRLLTLCALYVAQGIPYGFITITLAAFMADQGLGTEDVGNIIFWTTLPWAFKWVWGPVIDMLGVPSMGRRRPWIILAQIMMAVTMLVMVFVGDLTASVVALSWMTAIHNVFGSLQDVAVDALAVDLLDEAERGQANGLMWGSKYFENRHWGCRAWHCGGLYWTAGRNFCSGGAPLWNHDAAVVVHRAHWRATFSMVNRGEPA